MYRRVVTVRSIVGEAHEFGAAAMVDGEVFVWGGRNDTTLTTTGERFLP